MIKVLITNTDGKSFEAKFETMQEVNNWVEKESANFSWGKPARWMRADFGAPIDGYTDTRVVESNGVEVTEYFYPSEYTISIEDITQESAKEAVFDTVLTDEELGSEISRKISQLLRIKLSKQEITLEQLSAFIETKEVIQVERYLDKGYLTLAKLLMQNGEFSLLTTEEKNSFISMIGR